MFASFCLLSAALADDCLTDDQDRTLKTTVMSLDATLKVTTTSLNIAAMFKEEPDKSNLEQASKIISAVDDDLVTKMTGIVESTCGTCSQISKSVGDISQDLEKTMTDIEPDWKTNPIYASVTSAVNMILAIVPDFCPQYKLGRPFDGNGTSPDGVPCLTPDQDRDLHTAIMAVDATLKVTTSSLDIASMWKEGEEKENLEKASKIIGAVDTDLVEKMTSVVENTCGTCSMISTSVKDLVKDLEDTMTDIEPEWKMNPIYTSVVTAVNMILGIIPNFCPSMDLAKEELFIPAHILSSLAKRLL